MSIDLSLDRIRRLAGHLAPYTRPTIHIAGTNGKGSVASLVTSILVASDPPFRVGRFTSPHLLEPRDSLTIDGVALNAAAYRERLALVQEADETHQTHLSGFEILTLAAMSEFEEQKVDIVVLEVGLGGRLDATNIVPDSCIVVSALTSVDLDHQAFLGNTVELIAKEKVAIARAGKPFVLGKQAHNGVVSVVEEALGSLQSTLLLACQPRIIQTQTGPEQLPLTLSGFLRSPIVRIPLQDYDTREIDVRFPLLGEHQLDNLGVAVTLISEVRKYPFCGIGRITAKALSTGIEAIKWPGRLSFHRYKTASRTLEFLVDGAHNAAAANALASFIFQNIISQITTKISLVYILGLSHSPPKTAQETLAPLLTPLNTPRIRVSVAAVSFTPPEGMPWVKCTPTLDIIRAASVLAPGANVWTETEGSLESALVWAAGQWNDDCLNIIVIAGSLYLVADLYRLLS
ncbi:Mur ligase [Flagelloscypha sp. PMI_526]|nr:Mur ligase [Flagelloscypha sp. PMI_526]